ncbi:hypothetical protein CLOHYLEM_05486 [[Clostridium] hylemonae DSM 15053]|uniref:Uncharacterized protein n=1 Tax=[Clostridium] hylemonae DSM 15053 TaxID=553973 RepID=C0C092_9FIRM|nr:hypothetical protein CLOHYLEM_05486 [[Clostridium] hylemonae DSM 15053]
MSPRTPCAAERTGKGTATERSALRAKLARSYIAKFAVTRPEAESVVRENPTQKRGAAGWAYIGHAGGQELSRWQRYVIRKEKKCWRMKNNEKEKKALQP